MLVTAQTGTTPSQAVTWRRLKLKQINRARQLYKNISMLFLFPVTRDLLFTNI